MKADFKFNMPDLSALQPEVQRVTADVIRETAKDIHKDTQARWTGWDYKGRPSGTFPVSGPAWKINVEIDQDLHTIKLTNDAVDWRAEYYSRKGNSKAAAKYKNRPYVSLVKRNRGAEPEHLVIQKMILSIHIPMLEKRILEAVAGAVGQLPKTTRTPRASPKSGMTIIT